MKATEFLLTTQKVQDLEFSNSHDADVIFKHAKLYRCTSHNMTSTYCTCCARLLRVKKVFF